MPHIERFRPRRVAVFLPEGGQLIGTIGFYEALDAANRFRASRGEAPAYALSLVGLQGRTGSVAGFGLHTTPSTDIASADMVVVGGSRLEVPHDFEPALLAELDRLSHSAGRVVSLCLGAFALGRLGLLNGRRCTTHWMALDALRQRFPAALVEPDAIHTRDGGLYTSAGATAAIDLALQLVREDLGPRMALRVARSLVVFAQRPGGQSQFGSALTLRPGADERLDALIAGIVDAPGGDHRVDVLARRVGMSVRHFSRVFHEQTGSTPAVFVVRTRVEAAQRALVHTDASLERIAEDCGFGTTATLRRCFHRVAGVGPSAYRTRFRAQRTR